MVDAYNFKVNEDEAPDSEYAVFKRAHRAQFEREIAEKGLEVYIKGRDQKETYKVMNY